MKLTRRTTMKPPFENRPLTPTELASIIKNKRQEKGWTQEVLADLAKIKVRTVQRVEKGEASSVDTKRCLARALDWKDMDTFNKPWPFPNIDFLTKEAQRLEAETALISIEKVLNGRQLRELAENSQALSFSQLSELPKDAENIFAELQDYVRDYGDISDCYSATQNLEVTRDLQKLIDALSKLGFSIGAGNQKLRCGSENAKGTVLIGIFIVVGRIDGLTSTIRIPRQLTV
jgi:transcriptional regulator with XRE-family HTH domain